jgi:GT2 family glycosyltransferase
MIGVGVITCNRQSLFEVCINSIPKVDYLVVVNDGKSYENEIYTSKPDLIIEHKKNKGIASSKNQIIKVLIEKQCEHIFLVEDDIAIIRANVFNHYIKAAEKSGIYHLNFAFHGDGNCDMAGRPISRKIIYSNGIEILTLNKNLLGAFSYYHNSIIEKFGLMDERYRNGLEHVDHTYQIIKSGFHPPFWWFADAPKSYEFIQDQDVDHSKSIIRKNRVRWKFRMLYNIRRFKKKNGVSPFEILDSSEDFVLAELHRIQNEFSGSKILNISRFI